MTTAPTWVDAINRLLRAENRPDPNDPESMKRWNQGDLAQAAGIRPNTMSEILSAKREPSLDTLQKIATAFNVPLWMMFVTERQAAVLRDQQTNDELLARRTTLQEEVRQLVAEALVPVAERLTEAAVAKLTPAPEPPAVETPRKPRRKTA